MPIAPSDQHWMSLALQLARQGDIGTAPNPRVGCVVTHNNQILSKGWHSQIGGPHAEVNALNAAQDLKADLSQATAYVTLEPCSHHGKTPPCADRLIQSGIGRVVVGMVDPDPRVSGSGIGRLREAGIVVDVFPHWPEGRWLNRRFLSSLERGRPWIILKCAMSTDGFADPIRRQDEKGSIPLTHPKLKRLTHRWRAEEGAILVGAGTVVIDNPQLNVREAQGPAPLPVVLDPNGRTSNQAALYSAHLQSWVVGGPLELHPRAKRIPMGNAPILTTAIEALHQAGIRSVLVEGGPETVRRFMQTGLWDEYRICRGPSALQKGLAAPRAPSSAILRGAHPFGQDHLEYHLNPDSADWIGSAPSPTLSIALPS
jgi:diaminohydroxyphosphoribosylaminopyrimidine deaminase/5-amino-6-(5-phosphoribosylamino)uracil reductase